MNCFSFWRIRFLWSPLFKSTLYKQIIYKVIKCGTFINEDYPWMHETPDFLCSRHCGCGRCGEIKCPICIEPLSPMKFLDALLRIAASRSRQVFVPYSNILHVLGGFHLIRSQVMSLQFMKKLFWSQPKIIDQCHCFQLWAKLRNAAPVRGFITTSNSQLLLYNTDSSVPLRVLRNFCLYSIQSGEALDKNKQTNIFCQGFQHRWSCHSF